MLKTKTLIDKLGKEYEPMLNKVNIPNFTKCIAQYSGIDIKDLKDDIIEEYLTTWARNKKHFFDMFGDLVVDMPIEYIDTNTKTSEKIMEIARKYPTYYYWCEIFNNQKENKIDYGALSWDFKKRELDDMFPGYKIDGTTITHFFKEKLNAPDEIVTAIGRVFEHDKIVATYTMSIDPVDIMLSSENPYKWTSCYRLEHFEGSHADGCLAGVLDHDTIISYIWNNSGKLSLYNKYELKDIRYKKVRITLAVNGTYNAIHFNEVYPWKYDTPDDFRKMIRDKVETYFAEKAGIKNLWGKLERYIDGKSNYDFVRVLNPYRYHSQYGYGEYNSDRVYFVKDQDHYDEFSIYDEEIMCPCGCGVVYMGSDFCEDEYRSNGRGHVNENIEEVEDECNWDEWRVYNEDDDDIYDTDWGEGEAIEWAEEHDGAYVEHHWGGDYWSDYERVWTRPEEEEADPDPVEETSSEATTLITPSPTGIVASIGTDDITSNVGDVLGDMLRTYVYNNTSYTISIPAGTDSNNEEARSE